MRAFLSVVMALLFGLLSVTHAEAALLDQWPLQGLLEEATGGAEPTSDSVCGTALNFDGGDLIVIGTDVYSEEDFFWGISMALWVKLDNVSSHQRFFTNEGRGGVIGISADADPEIGKAARPDKAYFEMYSTLTGDHCVFSNLALEDNEWYFLVGTWQRPSLEEPAGTMRLYVNGVEQTDTFRAGNATMEDSIDTVNRAVCIGGQIDSLYTDGIIDEVAIYDAALSASEVETLYIEGLACKLECPPDLSEELAACEAALDQCVNVDLLACQSARDQCLDTDLPNALGCVDQLKSSAGALGLTVDGCAVQGKIVSVAPGQIKQQGVRNNPNAVQVVLP